MGLAAAKRRQQLQHAVSGAVAKPRKHILQQRTQPLGQVGDAEEVFGIAVHGWDVGLAVGQGTKVERKDIFGEVF